MISGIGVTDAVKTRYANKSELSKGDLHRVDNGFVWWDGEIYNDLSHPIKDIMKPRVSQRMYDWYVDMYNIGISNSRLSDHTIKAMFMKNISENGDMCYYPAFKCLRPGVIPWFMYSDMDVRIFDKFDGVKLYNDMYNRGFMYGVYSVRYISWEDGCVREVEGNIACIPFTPANLSPSYYMGADSYEIVTVFNRSDTIELFYTPNWIPTDKSIGAYQLSNMATTQRMNANSSGVGGFTGKPVNTL